MKSFLSEKVKQTFNNAYYKDLKKISIEFKKIKKKVFKQKH